MLRVYVIFMYLLKLDIDYYNYFIPQIITEMTEQTKSVFAIMSINLVLFLLMRLYLVIFSYMNS